jgi:arylsulfatase A-like enzyme
MKRFLQVSVFASSLMSTALAGSANARPNIIVVLLDDVKYTAVSGMPKTIRSLTRRGTTFVNSFVDFSVCFQSRTSFLTGLAAHNHGVVRPAHVYDDFSAYEGHTIADWLQRAGYATALIGKYMNGYSQAKTRVPPGWSEWYAMVTTSYYDYTLNVMTTH